MPITKISDVIVPEIFNPYVISRTMELSALFQSGIVVNNAEFDRLASEAARTPVSYTHLDVYKRQKLARLLKYQQELRMRGVVVGPDGVEKITLLDDFYEPLIQKQIKLISELELKIHKMQDDSNGDSDNVEIVDDLGGGSDAGKIE